MKKIILFIMFGFPFISSCGDGDTIIPTIHPDKTGEFIDERNDISYPWVRFGELDWMTKNMCFFVSQDNTLIYQWETELGRETINKSLETYGYIYNFTAANIVCPEGWRLPSDKDWQDLEFRLGMKNNELDKLEWRGDYQGELLQQDANGTGMNLQAGGFYSISHSIGTSFKYRYFGVYGYFWTSTEDEDRSDYVFYRKIGYNEERFYRHVTMKGNFFSVRCVRDSVN